MAQIVYRANLSAKGFPFDPANFGRSVIIPGHDQNFNRQLVSREDQDKDIGIPQAFYMHNVIPAEYGYRSVFWEAITFSPPEWSTGNPFVSEVTAYPYNGTVHFFSQRVSGNQGRFFSNLEGSSALNVHNSSDPVFSETSAATLTTAQVGARIFLAYRNTVPPVDVWEITNYASPPIPAVNLVGFPDTELRGILASRGHLIWWSANRVGWSSLLDPLDHVPSLITGAGNTRIQEAKGDIIFCVETLWGFIIYCRFNIVTAEYTGNIEFPWIFKEIYNSAGITSYKHVTRDDSLDIHYAFTRSGIVRIANNSATLVVPELAAMLRNAFLQVFNTPTNQFVDYIFGTNPEFSVAIFFVGKRYLAISFGTGNALIDSVPYNYSFLYDVALQRWGMIKVEHTALFTTFRGGLAEIAALQHNGVVQRMRPATFSETTDACIVFGKYQLSRPLLTSLQVIELESRLLSALPTIAIVHTSLLGKATNTITLPVSNVHAAGLRIWNNKTVGTNHTVIFKGSFDINSLVLRFTQHGRR